MKGGKAHLATRQHAHYLGERAFTIVEIMIVLAVSGFLFVSVAALMSGRQSAARFNQAVNNLKAQLEQTISEAENGYFGDNGATCYVAGNASPRPAEECVYVGKLVQFSTTAANQYRVYALMGQRSATTLATAAAITGQSQSMPLSDGLAPVWMRSGGVDINSFAAVGQFGQDTTGGASGSRNVWVIPRLSGTLGGGFLAAQTAMPASFSANVNPTGGVELCMAGGSSDRSALFTIGAANAARTVDVSIKNGAVCA